MILSLLSLYLRVGLKYVCDPVMGDIGPGFYVPKVRGVFYKTKIEKKNLIWRYIRS